MTDSRIVFNLGLLFEEPLAKKLTQYSGLLNRVFPGVYVLGPQSLPHITLTQFYGEEKEAASLWDRVRPLGSSSLCVDFIGFSLGRWGGWDSLSLRVVRSRALEELQSNAYSLLGISAAINALGDRYDPHVTLLAWPSVDLIPSFFIESALLDLKGSPTTLTLGKSGPNFQYSQRLF